jgi:uncharacterized membrane protein
MPDKIYLWHPVFVHFSVALLLVAALFYVVAIIARSKPIAQQWLVVAQWNLWLGIVLTGLTVLFGWLAFNSVRHDDATHELMLAHRNWALATTVMFAVLALWSFWDRKERRYLSWTFAALMILASCSLLATAWRGGELVYGHGLAVSALPKADEERSGMAVPAAAQENQATPNEATPRDRQDPSKASPDAHAHPHHHHDGKE